MFEAHPPGRAGPAWLRANLPPELQARFEPMRSLNVSAGQADLMVCRDRTTGANVVIKLYRYSDQLDRAVLAKLYQADPRHVVRLLDHGESQGVPWEVQEYCLNGTLADLRQRLGGRVPLLQMPHIVRELAEALHHIHALGITHRDFKPQNVLVRAPGPPPDLVLTDFGVAREQFQATQFTSIRATFAWAAPEVHEGVQKAPVDWWALGATIFELLTGRHLLADAAGQLLPDVQVRPIVMRGLYSTDPLGPGRWRDLVDGLLTHNSDRRWGFEQVEAWLNGGDPPVDRSLIGQGRGRAGSVGAAGPAGTQSAPGIRFVFNGRPVSTGTELVAAMRQDWGPAEALLAGRIDPLLTEWLSATPEGFRAVQEMRLENTAGARFVRLQTALDPASPAEFRGRRLDEATLAHGIGQAVGWRPGGPAEAEQAADWLLAVAEQRVLRAVAGSGRPGQAAGERLGAADLRLEGWHGQARRVAERAPGGDMAELVALREKALIGQFFAIAFGSAPAEPLAREMIQQVERRNTAGALWLEGQAVAAAKLSGDQLSASLGHLAAVAVLCEAVTLDNAEAGREAAARREAAEATAQAEARLAEREMSVARRGHATRVLVGQLRWRTAVGLVYALFGGWELTRWGLFTGGALQESLIVFGFAVAGVALATLVDWLIENPAGNLRAAMATAGGFVGAMIWLEGLRSTYLGRPTVWSVPLVFATAWILGSILSFGLRALTRGRSVVDPAERSRRRAARAAASRAAAPAAGLAGARNGTAAHGPVGGPAGGGPVSGGGFPAWPGLPGAGAGGAAVPAAGAGMAPYAGPDEYESTMATQRRIAKTFRRAAVARAWVWVAVGAALFAAASGLVFDSCGADCRPLHQALLGRVANQSALPFDPLSLGHNPWIVGLVALIAWLAHLASRPLMRFHWQPGWAAMWAGLALAVVVLAISPDSPAAWLASWLSTLTPS
jgi:hypothetical protein